VIPDYESYKDIKWIIPKKRINPSLSPENLDLLNQFNRLNIGDRGFDLSLPLKSTGLFPKEKSRLELRMAQLRATSKGKKIILNFIPWRVYRFLERLKNSFSRLNK